MTLDQKTRAYLAEIGRRGGKASRRQLTPEQAREMVRVREARRAFRDFYGACFWSYDPDRPIGREDVEWVARTLMREGGREAWLRGSKLCR